MDSKVKSLEPHLLTKLKIFTDREIGQGYYSLQELSEIISHSYDGDGGKHPVSFVLLDQSSEIQGVRLSYPPGKWMHRYPGKKLNPEKWGINPDLAGYFKSLFISEKFQRDGWGPTLSQMSKRQMIELGAQAIVTHCWKESPGGSSQKYLERQGFKAIAEHPFFWAEVDYHCSGCLKKPCVCTSIEMILHL